MKIPVWVYWQGPVPEYIQLCIDTMRTACRRDPRCEFHLVSKSNLGEYLQPGTLEPSWLAIREEGVASDCVRCALLATHGGVYLDADTICLKSPSLLYSPSHVTYAVWATKVPWRAIAGYVSAPKGSPIMAEWLAQQNKAVRAGHTNWMALGEAMLTPLVKARPADGRVIERRIVLPIDIDSNVEAFFRPGDWLDHILPETVCFGLNHSYMTSRHPHEMRMSLRDMGTSKLLIHRLLSYANETLR